MSRRPMTTPPIGPSGPPPSGSLLRNSSARPSMATIPLPPDFKDLLRLLRTEEVRYLLVGGSKAWAKSSAWEYLLPDRADVPCERAGIRRMLRGAWKRASTAFWFQLSVKG